MQLVWFKRDLRVADHAPLAAAAARGPVLPLWIVEPGLWAEPDASARQYRVQQEAAAELRADLAALGQPLVVRVGEAVAVLETIRRTRGIAAIWAHQETTGAFGYARDRRVRAWARAHGIAVHEPRQTGAIRALASRVTVNEDPALTAMLPQARPARVTLRLADGRAFTQLAITNRGDTEDPYPVSEVEAKFVEITA
ncbi:MAG: deoxyribodipyrimidine photo-lyase, partial [Elioraea tepidiphila]